MAIISDSKIDDLQFKKWLFCDQRSTQLLVFVDASENTYAAVTYFRFALDDQVECALISAKTIKVSPRKPMSIPKLKLQAAVL